MAAACQCMREGNPVPCPHMKPCGPANSSTGFVQCCYGIDICGADLFCRSTSTTGELGYYAGGCTDATYRDDSCSKQCGSQTETPAVYSQSTGNWTCCYDNAKGASNCSSPTNITFEAPSPEVLFAEPFSVMTASPTSSSTSPTGTSTFNQNIESPITSSTPSTTVQTVTMTATTTATASAGNSPSLSTGAEVGIGVGAVVLFIIGVGALLVWRRQSRRRQQQAEQLRQPFMRHGSILKVSPDLGVRQLHEVDGSERKAEIQSYTELPYNNVTQYEYSPTRST